MKVLGIVAEYNPYHNGHLHQINQAKKITGAKYAVAIMSGHFVQRGVPAVLPKETRAAMALMNGIDLVLELPTLFATSSAEFFAANAIYLLHHTNTITHLCFGMEEQNTAELSALADFLLKETQPFQTAIKKFIKEGDAYPKAREKAIEETFAHNGCLKHPNNILAIEYLKALKKLNSPIEPLGIQRKEASYHEKTIASPIASATAIRQATLKNQWAQVQPTMPENISSLYRKEILHRGIPRLDDFTALFHYLFYQNKNNTTQGFHKDLQHRIDAVAQKHYHLSALLDEIKTKRYTYTMLQRYILHTILQITEEKTMHYHYHLPYLRVLGFQKKSAPLLKILMENASLPVISNIKNAPEDKEIQNLLADEFFYSQIYDLPAREKIGYQNKREPSRPLVIL